jgi:outer membrane protein assembly factor BamB
MRRRTVLTTVSGALLGAAAGCVSAPGRESGGGTEGTPTGSAEPSAETPAGTWPQVAYDARNTRHTPNARGPRNDATVAWQSLGDRPVYPPVVDSDLYLTEAWTGGTALSLAATDGTERWSNGDLPPMRWAPALHDGRLFVLSREAGNVVRLHALDTATGEQVWVRERGVTASSGEHPPVGPTVHGGSVYLASSRGVLACGATTGDVEWTATLGPHVVETEDGPTWRTDWATPAVTPERVFTFDTTESYRATREVYAVDRATGGREWTAELDVGDGWSLGGYAVAGADRVFVRAVKPFAAVGDSLRPGAARLFALDADSGAVTWDWAVSKRTLTLPAYADGTLYVGAWAPGADAQRLHALDAADGSRQWTYRTPNSVRTPTVAGDTLYVSQGESLDAVDVADGTRRWRLDIGARVAPPVVVGDTAYVRTNPGHDYDSRVLAVREP